MFKGIIVLKYNNFGRDDEYLNIFGYSNRNIIIYKKNNLKKYQRVGKIISKLEDIGRIKSYIPEGSSLLTICIEFL
jgi:hypothetical protein